MIVDFGALGLQVSVYRLQYPSALECMAHVYTQEISGDWVDAQFVKRFEPLVLARWKEVMEAEGRTDLLSGGKKAEDTAEFQYVKNHSLVQAVHQILGQLGQPGEVSESVTLIPFEAEMQISITPIQAEALLSQKMKGCIRDAVSQALQKAQQLMPDFSIDHVRVTGAASLHPVFRRLLAEQVGADSMYSFHPSIYRYCIFPMLCLDLYISPYAYFYTYNHWHLSEYLLSSPSLLSIYLFSLSPHQN